jgi:hypothetical protein
VLSYFLVKKVVSIRQVPIRRVDSLLLEGEKFPFDFSKVFVLYKY